jgi:hypothetical protein
MVPGGWSRRKKNALGPQGCTAVRRFVQRGGFYLGLCGGAGLALGVEDGLSLLPLGRISGQERLTAISGPVMVEPSPGAASLPWWQGLKSPARFQVWWPGQFAKPQDNEVRILAYYTGPAPGLCTSDIEADLVAEEEWAALEAEYRSSLDPARLKGLPAVISGNYGQGKVFISYLHFDTPGDPNGARVLFNIWRQVLGGKARAEDPLPPAGDHHQLAGIAAKAHELWEMGQELSLWQPRSSPALFPLWKRGSRGLEFFSLMYMLDAAVSLAHQGIPALRDELDELLRPIFDNGPEVLTTQAAILAGKRQSAGVHARWFPKPRRTGGELARAMQGLESHLQSLL